MEVHHHSNVHHSKKWKDYLYEFLMLFLAVSAGFFMENLRDRHVENERAEILAVSLCDDIKKDTVALNDAIAYSKIKILSIDSGIKILHSPRKEWNDTVFYRALGITARILPFDRTQDTYEQLKSSGALRYFKQSLVNLMNAYDVQAKKVIIREDVDAHFIVDQFFPFTIKNVNAEVIADMVQKRPIMHELYLNNSDEITNREFINYLTITKNLRYRASQEYVKLKVCGVELINELKKEYRME